MSTSLLSHRLPLVSILFLASFFASIPDCSARDEEKPDPDPARFMDAIKTFEESDRESPPVPGGLLFVGSSSIRRWDLEPYFPQLDVLNRGFGGSQLSDVIHYVDEVITPYQPRLIVFYEGDNDLSAGKSAERVRDDLFKLLDLLRTKSPESTLLFLSIKPSPARRELWPEMQRANSLIKRAAEQDSHLQYVDVATPMLSPDGSFRPELYVEDELHMNEKGYAIWASVLNPILESPPTAPGN